MPVDFSERGGLGVITLDNPPANSYDLRVMKEFGAAVEAADASSARVVLVRSASTKFFSAGADVKRFLEGDIDSNMEMIHVSQVSFRRMAESSTVFVAHINGHALGGGLEIALACDIRLANAGDYKLGTPEVTLGLLPGNGGTQRLPRLIGSARALDLLITGRTISPREALDWGLVSALYEPDAAVEQVDEYARRFAAGPTLAFAGIKRCVYEGAQRPLSDGLALEAESIERLFRSNDGREGLAAFVEKRQPRFTGA